MGEPAGNTAFLNRTAGSLIVKNLTMHLLATRPPSVRSGTLETTVEEVVIFAESKILRF